VAFVSTRPYVSLLREKKQKGIRLERRKCLARENTISKGEKKQTKKKQKK